MIADNLSAQVLKRVGRRCSQRTSGESDCISRPGLLIVADTLGFRCLVDLQRSSRDVVRRRRQCQLAFSDLST